MRKAAYTNIMNGYNKYGNTIAATYAGCVKADIFNSRSHRFDSCRQAAMYPDEIDESVYDSLIDAVHGRHRHGSTSTCPTRRSSLVCLSCICMTSMRIRITDLTSASTLRKRQDVPGGGCAAGRGLCGSGEPCASRPLD